MTNFKSIITVATFGGVIMLSACGGGETLEEVVQQEVEQQIEEMPVETAAPVITPAPSPEPDYSQSDCSGINVADTSIYVPEDWNAWCDGYMALDTIWQSSSAAEQNAVCGEFWAMPDADLLQAGILEWGMTRDQTIGFIDYLWINC